MFMSCVYPVAIVNAAFCVISSLLSFFFGGGRDERGDDMDGAYSRFGRTTA